MPLFRAGAAEPAELAVGSHEHHVEHADGKIPIDAFPLWDVADPPPHLGHGLAEHLYAAAGHRHEAQGGFDERALASAVGADDRRELRLLNCQIDIPDHWPAVVGDGDIVDVEEGGHFKAATIVSTLCLTIPS